MPGWMAIHPGKVDLAAVGRCDVAGVVYLVRTIGVAPAPRTIEVLEAEANGVDELMTDRTLGLAPMGPWEPARVCGLS